MTTPAPISLPWPPSSLSGHNKGGWRTKLGTVRKFRLWAATATRAARPVVAAHGDIHIVIRFIPPNRRGDRTNYPNRIKPILDGVADALGVNDRRFLPSYQFADPEQPGRVEIIIGGPYED